jgi:hypothetical protein
MRVTVFGSRVAIVVLASALLPMLPLFAINQPIPDLLAKIGHAILGGLPP